MISAIAGAYGDLSQEFKEDHKDMLEQDRDKVEAVCRGTRICSSKNEDASSPKGGTSKPRGSLAQVEPADASEGSAMPKRKKIEGTSPGGDAFALQESLKKFWKERAVRA